MGPVTYCRRSGRWQRAWKGVVAVDGSPKKWAGLITINRTLINTHIRHKHLEKMLCSSQMKRRYLGGALQIDTSFKVLRKCFVAHWF